jgi:hypothetical protein
MEFPDNLQKPIITATEVAMKRGLSKTISPTILERIDFHIKEVEERLEQLKRVRVILTENKEIHELLTLMRETGL